MSKWIEYQPVIDEIKYEWCNKCNKTCPYNNCKIYRVMQILRRQKPIPHDRSIGEWICITKSTFPQYQPDEYKCSQCNKLCHIKYYFCPFCGSKMRGEDNG
jgi:hypothetical protein